MFARLFELLAVVAFAISFVEAWTDLEEARAASSATCNDEEGFGREACSMAMLQKTFSSKPNVVGLVSAEANFGPNVVSTPKTASVSFTDASYLIGVTGTTAQLDESGYQKLVQLQSKHEMGNFVRRLVDKLGIKIVNEEGFRNAASFFNGENESRNFEAIVNLLQQEASKPCSWVTRRGKAAKHNGTTAPLTEEGYRMVTELRDTNEMILFAGRVVEDQGYFVTDPFALSGMVPYHSCEKGIQTLEKMQNEIRGCAASPKCWVSIAPNRNIKRRGKMSLVHAPSEVESHANSPSVGTSAQLSREGYDEVAHAKSNIEMSIFVLRAIRQMGLQVIDEDRFRGLIPFYSGDMSTQSFEGLKTEVMKISKELCAWIIPVEEEGEKSMDGKSAPLSERGYAAVARLRSPVDMRDFIHRVLRDMHMQVLDKGGLMGFIPFHDCEKDAKTFKALKQEILEAARQENSWVKETAGAKAIEHVKASRASSASARSSEEAENDFTRRQGSESGAYDAADFEDAAISNTSGETNKAHASTSDEMQGNTHAKESHSTSAVSDKNKEMSDQDGNGIFGKSTSEEKESHSNSGVSNKSKKMSNQDGNGIFGKSASEENDKVSSQNHDKLKPMSKEKGSDASRKSSSESSDKGKEFNDGDDTGIFGRLATNKSDKLPSKKDEELKPAPGSSKEKGSEDSRKPSSKKHDKGKELNNGDGNGISGKHTSDERGKAPSQRDGKRSISEYTSTTTGADSTGASTTSGSDSMGTSTSIGADDIGTPTTTATDGRDTSTTTATDSRDTSTTTGTDNDDDREYSDYSNPNAGRLLQKARDELQKERKEKDQSLRQKKAENSHSTAQTKKVDKSGASSKASEATQGKAPMAIGHGHRHTSVEDAMKNSTKTHASASSLVTSKSQRPHHPPTETAAVGASRRERQSKAGSKANDPNDVEDLLLRPAAPTTDGEALYTKSYKRRYELKSFSPALKNSDTAHIGRKPVFQAQR